VAGVQFFYDLIDERMARLEELLELHEEIAGDEADELADRVSSDDSVRGERRRRQQTAKARELRQTIELLLKMQKGDGKERNGRAASDLGKMNGDEKAMPAPKTPALAAAARREEQCEPGSASKPVSRKRSKDRQHLAPALEMVMSERLAEQVFEKLFDDPPAELASLKGSPKLAELKVLPGRAPVRATATRESTASEKGAKNAQIEAKHDETQVDGGNEDKLHAFDSGGNKRTQFDVRRKGADRP
jgi:hypothetical protein